ncbi:4-oxalocrotonate tautomerase family protein [Allohahella marinimesophila]|uniref:Tautomerase n=2 Tax=Allohahella marinimesophila TaxID=1054972 RepID=A0ABP7NGJ4_9GAMM
MPYVNIKVTREGGPGGAGPSTQQKAELISGVTELLAKVLGKNPNSTVVVIDEVDLENWGIGGLPVPEYREKTNASISSTQ